MEEEERCSLCMFFDKEWKTCRRYPPEIDLEDVYNSRYPTVSVGDWCGEFVWQDPDSVAEIGKPKCWRKDLNP